MADTIEESSTEAIAVLLTGDNADAARVHAEHVGTHPQDVIAKVLPHEKVAVIKRLHGEGRPSR